VSDGLYPTRLRWHHTTGVARHDGVSVELVAAPMLAGMDCMTEIDYVPHVIAQVRIGCNAVRDMTAQERIDVMEMLVRVSAAARKAVSTGVAFA
jgi:hypothetical protein